QSIGIERIGSARLRRKDNVSAPGVAPFCLHADSWPQRRDRTAEAHQQILRAVTNQQAIAERYGPALIEPHATEGHARISERSFTQHQRRMGPGSDRARRQPNRGPSARGLLVVTHLARNEQFAFAELLVISKRRSRR